MSHLPLSYRREVADKILVYLKTNGVQSCPNTYATLRGISAEIKEPLFVLWRAFELLRIMARVELNNPNGKRGFKVLDYNPLSISLPDRPSVPICEVAHCPILKILQRKFSIVIKAKS